MLDILEDPDGVANLDRYYSKHQERSGKQRDRQPESGFHGFAVVRLTYVPTAAGRLVNRPPPPELRRPAGEVPNDEESGAGQKR